MLAAMEGEANMDLPTQLEHSQERCLLRGSWQLASVFHFLNIFRTVLDLNLKFSMEELETALLVPNSLLFDIHIGLLKAIPPSSRNPINQETWIAVLCKKLKDWWPSVAEGPFPLVAKGGDEVMIYKDLSPDVRVIILKALCEVRLDHEDMRAFIGEMAKQETSFLNIRKESTGTDMQGATYWYENDSIAGQRLYRELLKSDKDKIKLRGHLVSPPAISEWETLATNLEEFQSVVDKLCSSRNKSEVGLGKKINIDILPDLINAEKRKQRALKKQLRQAALLDNNFRAEGVAATRSRRDRKPVSYTFDDFDNTIDEALEVMTTLSNGSAKEDTDEDMDENLGTKTIPHTKSESTETATQSSKSDSFSNGYNGRRVHNRVLRKATKSNASDATDSDTDAFSGNDSKGEPDHILNKKRRLESSSGAYSRRSEEMKEHSEGVCDCDIKEENMDSLQEGERNLTTFKRRGKRQGTQGIAKASRGTRRDTDCSNQGSDVDSKRLEGSERDEMASLSACSNEKISIREELNAGACEALGKSEPDIEDCDLKNPKASEGALRTAKHKLLDDCRRGKKMQILSNPNGPKPVGV